MEGVVSEFGDGGGGNEGNTGEGGGGLTQAVL